MAFTRGEVTAEGPVESWLVKVEQAMRDALYDNAKKAVNEYPTSRDDSIRRDKWLWDYPAQVCVCVCLVVLETLGKDTQHCSTRLCLAMRAGMYARRKSGRVGRGRCHARSLRRAVWALFSLRDWTSDRSNSHAFAMAHWVEGDVGDVVQIDEHRAASHRTYVPCV